VVQGVSAAEVLLHCEDEEIVSGIIETNK